MEQYIPKSALVAEIESRIKSLEECFNGKFPMSQSVKETEQDKGKLVAYKSILSFIDTLEAKEVGVWKTVDNINPPQADRNKIYCVFTKGRYILAKVIDHPKDEESLQWKCTEFPHHRYDMCEGDKYMVIN